MEIDNIDHVKCLVFYALSTRDEKICRDIDLTVAQWLEELKDQELAEEIREEIWEDGFNDDWWENIINGTKIGTFKPDEPPNPTHTDLRKMYRDIYDLLGEHENAKVLSADDIRYNFIGHVVYWGEEQSKYFTIKMSDIQLSSRELLNGIYFAENRIKLFKGTNEECRKKLTKLLEIK